jgi:MFS family permease
MKETLNAYLPKPATRVALYAALLSFLTYASVYAFRKPFTVGTFEQEDRVFGIPYKDALVIAQALGYMISKFYGIRFIAELGKFGRGNLIILLVTISWIALLLFGITPAPWNIVFLFLNGFPLGIIWGILFSYIEGRKATDFIGAALAVSFIFSSGFVKTVAKWLWITFPISEKWIPFATGALFIIPLICFVKLLEKIPPPSEEDRLLRVERSPMNKEERKVFFGKYAAGLVLLIFVYIVLTIFRDIRDNFAADIWKTLGYGSLPSVFSKTEIPITLMVLVLMGSMMLIKNNTRAFILTHYLIIVGFLIAGISSMLFVMHLLDPIPWMTLVGLGLYMGYIPFNCLLFERLIAAFRQPGNIGFLMYLADSFGYLGSVVIIIAKTFMKNTNSWTYLYSNGVIIFSVIGICATIAALIYFKKKLNLIPKNQQYAVN